MGIAQLPSGTYTLPKTKEGRVRLKRDELFSGG